MNQADPDTPAQALPEGRWLWRRLYVYGLSAAIWVTLCAVLMRVPVADSVVVAFALMRLLTLVLLVYLVAPSAQQIVGVALAALGQRAGASR